MTRHIFHPITDHRPTDRPTDRGQEFSTRHVRATAITDADTSAEATVRCIALSHVGVAGDKFAPLLALGMGEGRVDVWSS